MKFDKFMERCNGAPCDLDEVAHDASKVSDNCDLSMAAKDYLVAKEAFESALNAVGFEFG